MLNVDSDLLSAEDFVVEVLAFGLLALYGVQAVNECVFVVFAVCHDLILDGVFGL